MEPKYKRVPYFKQQHMLPKIANMHEPENKNIDQLFQLSV
jgi:hypothetical protein